MSQVEEQEVTLAALGGGAVEERFARERDALLENLRDPNTSAKAKRSITVVITFEPREDRQFTAITAQVTSKLAPDVPVAAFAVIGKKDGVVIATEARPRKGADPRQTELPENVREMPAQRAKEEKS
jgi:hypothetical protein